MIKIKYRPITLLIISLIWGSSVQAQESVNVSGGDATGTGGTVAYSLGQVVYNTNTDATGTVSQGVQQSFEVFSVGTNETSIRITLALYPNPTSNILNLIVKDYNNEKLSYQLHDLKGGLIASQPIVTSQTHINLGSLPSAVYLVYVIQDNKEVQTFKIIKSR